MKAVITGATGKIGKVFIPFLASKGATLFLHHRSISDLSTVEGVRKFVERAQKELGDIDVLIHLASRFERKNFENITEEDWDRSFAVDLKAAFFLAQKLAPHMKEGGSMIFMSDIYVEKPYPHGIPYCIAKGGVNTLTKALAKVFAGRLRVHALALPSIDTKEEMLQVCDRIWNLATEEKGSGHVYCL